MYLFGPRYSVEFEKLDLVMEIVASEHESVIPLPRVLLEEVDVQSHAPLEPVLVLARVLFPWIGEDTFQAMDLLALLTELRTHTRKFVWLPRPPKCYARKEFLNGLEPLGKALQSQHLRVLLKDPDDRNIFDQSHDEVSDFVDLAP